MSANNKYQILEDDTCKTFNGVVLRRIKALIDIPDIGVKVGDLGGYIEHERNLDTSGKSWVYPGAMVYDDAVISENARVASTAIVSGKARASGNALVSNNSRLGDNAWVRDNAQMFGCSLVGDNAEVSGNAVMEGYSKVYNNARISGDSRISGDAHISTDALVEDSLQSGCIGSIGYDYDSLTWFRSTTGINIVYSGFDGSLEEFEHFVKNTHGNSHLAQEFELVIAFIRLRATTFNQ